MLVMQGESVASMSIKVDDPSERAAKLRAQAERYRLLAESLFDRNLAEAAQECARDLEKQARAEEGLQTWNATKAA